MRKRLPLVLAVLALVVALFAATPLSEAAPAWVKRALFAKNAGKVDGIDASKTPKPNQLLALNKGKQFPANVVPAEAKGKALMKFRDGPAPVPDFLASIAHLDLPPGKYVVIAKAWFRNMGPTQVVVDCWLQPWLADRSQEMLGPAGGFSERHSITLTSIEEQDMGGSVDLLCNDLGISDVQANHIKLTAISVGSVTSTPGLP